MESKEVAYRSLSSPARIVGITKSFQGLGSCLGEPLCLAWHRAQGAYGILGFATLAVLTSIPLLIFRESTDRAVNGPEESGAERDGNVAGSSRVSAASCKKVKGYERLTPRETEVLSYLIQGRSLPYIEQQLGISHSTANSHTCNIYKKLEVHTRQELLDKFISG